MWGSGTVLGGRYTLVERLGGGAMGEVWRADDGVLERQVAVKILLPALLADAKFAERFRREAKVLAALDHPGIVDVHDYGESGSEPRVAYIVMELVEGRPLDAVLADGGEEGEGSRGKGGAMPVDRALGIAAQALDALHAAHVRGIVHRDVKPSNLMIGAEDRVTVTDFGIAHSTAETKLTASHAVLGTARYIAPEQARGSGAVPASDQYAIGVLCYELLSGEPLFTGEAVFEVLLKHIREPAPELSADFPEAVRAFVARALAKEPEDRYADAAEMAAAARAAVAGGADADSDADSDSDSGGVVAVTAASVASAVPLPVVVAAPASVPAVVPGAGSAAIPTPESAADPNPAPSPSASVEEAPVAGDVPGDPDPAPATRAWKRHGLAAVLLVLGVIAGVVATVVLVRPDHGRADANRGAPNAQSGEAASRTPVAGAADPGPGSAPPPTSATTPPASPNPAGGQSSGTNQGSTGTGVAPPPGGNAGTTNGSTAGGAAGSPGGGGSGGNPPKLPTTTAPPAQGVPQGCGGDRWGAITSVADGARIGLAADGPTRSKEVVMGGYSQYGWVHSVSTWDSFNTCSLSGPALGQPYGNSERPELAIEFGYSTNWRLSAAPTSGAVYIKDYMGKNCLTNNGSGKALSVVSCTPGSKYQQWRIP